MTKRETAVHIAVLLGCVALGMVAAKAHTWWTIHEQEHALLRRAAPLLQEALSRSAQPPPPQASRPSPEVKQ